MKPVSKQRIGKHAYNNRSIVGNGVIGNTPCGGGVEYLHRDPASRRRRGKGKTRIWDSKIPVLSSERAPRINKPATFWQYEKSGRKPQMGSLFRDRLANWPSFLTEDSDSESAVEFRSSKWAVSRGLSSAREAKKMALYVQVWSVN
jgi:hypothetical protein